MIITVMYRRRRAPHPGVDEWNWRGNGTHMFVDNGNGAVLVEQPRKKRKKLGPEPRMWDAVMAEDEDFGSEDGADDGTDESGGKEVDEKGVGRRRDNIAAWSVSS